MARQRVRNLENVGDSVRHPLSKSTSFLAAYLGRCSCIPSDDQAGWPGMSDKNRSRWRHWNVAKSACRPCGGRGRLSGKVRGVGRGMPALTAWARHPCAYCLGMAPCVTAGLPLQFAPAGVMRGRFRLLGTREATCQECAETCGNAQGKAGNARKQDAAWFAGDAAGGARGSADSGRAGHADAGCKLGG